MTGPSIVRSRGVVRVHPGRVVTVGLDNSTTRKGGGRLGCKDKLVIHGTTHGLGTLAKSAVIADTQESPLHDAVFDGSTTTSAATVARTVTAKAATVSEEK